MLKAISNPSFTFIIACFVSVAAAKGINYKQPFFSAAVLRTIHSFPFRIVSFLISFWFFTLEEGAFNFHKKEKPRLNLRLLFNTLNVELAGFYLYLKLLLKLTILNKRDYILDDCFESSLPGIVGLESIARLGRSAGLLWFSTNIFHCYIWCCFSPIFGNFKPLKPFQ